MIFTRLIAIVAAAMLVGATVPTEVSALTKQESKCAKKMPGTALKLASTILKETSKCLDADISGKATGACPNAGNLAKIDKTRAKLLSAIEKNCQSTCSVSGLPCVSDVSCPPLGPPAGREGCNAGAKLNPFDIRNLGFPGALCPLTIGGNVVSTDDVNECVSALTDDVTNAFVAAVYGSITNASGLTSGAAKCLSSISKAASKLGATALKTSNKCRANIDKGKLTVAPDNCLTADPKSADKVAKAEAKLAKTIDGKCTDGDIALLDICGNGVAGTVDKAEATACLTAQARQLFVASSLTYGDRSATVPSLEEAVYPPIARCGDGLVNGLQGQFNQYAEACDRENDAACGAGACLPPGDLFECLCDNKLLSVYQADSALSELDSGWTGASHDSTVGEKGGFVSGLSNCDCTEFDGPTCIGVTVDPVCNTNGIQMPRCSWDPAGVMGCDDHGDGDGVARDDDCYVCDEFSSNAGASCGCIDDVGPNGSCANDAGDCNAQCFDAGGTPTGPCTQQSDCGADEVCRGKCDFEASCLRVLLSHPTPSSSSGNPTCLDTEFREDVFGTSNIVTGERETFNLLRTRVYSGISVPQPCPVCGGICIGGTQDAEICEGTCSGGGGACRVDSDCDEEQGETCTTASPDCPGGICELELKCFGGANDGQACRIGSYTPLFGTTSADCPSLPGVNISGDGLVVNFAPATSEITTLEYTLPCTAPGFELYGCPCPDGGIPQSAPTKPNTCAPACDSGAELGTGCGIGNSAGVFTTCVGGGNVGKACDEDSDCPASTCSGNPTHCVGTGNPAQELNKCTTNADCGLGTCEDACPSGRCVPLCVEDPIDNQDGICAAGPIQYRCNGPKDVFRTCTAAEFNGSCSATCSIAATPCFADGDCPTGETCEGECIKARNCAAGEDGILGTADDILNAGTCETSDRNCFLNPIVTEGGDTLNGQGSPSHANSPTVYCTEPLLSLLINGAVGLGGPGRLRSQGTVYTNGVLSLP